jgi:hypothetical protein
MSGQRRLEVLSRHLAASAERAPELSRASAAASSSSSSSIDSSSWFKGRVVIITGA